MGSDARRLGAALLLCGRCARHSSILYNVFVFVDDFHIKFRKDGARCFAVAALGPSAVSALLRTPAPRARNIHRRRVCSLRAPRRRLGWIRCVVLRFWAELRCGLERRVLRDVRLRSRHLHVRTHGGQSTSGADRQPPRRRRRNGHHGSSQLSSGGPSTGAPE